MDPYLKTHWGDVHHSLVHYASDALQPLLPEDLCARIDERLVLESCEARPCRIPLDAGGIAVAEPLIIEELEVTEGFIEIRDGEGRLITAIEFLSPANKSRRDGEKKYLKKQTEVLEARANLVEIDLVRAGHYVLAAPEGKVPPAVRNDYLACITLPDSFTLIYEVYPLPLRRRLPALPIPLRKKEPRIPLDLQSLLDHAYSAGRYHTLDYAAPLIIPLAPETPPGRRRSCAAPRSCDASSQEVPVAPSPPVPHTARTPRELSAAGMPQLRTFGDDDPCSRRRIVVKVPRRRSEIEPGLVWPPSEVLRDQAISFRALAKVAQRYGDIGLAAGSVAVPFMDRVVEKQRSDSTIIVSGTGNGEWSPCGHLYGDWCGVIGRIHVADHGVPRRVIEGHIERGHRRDRIVRGNPDTLAATHQRWHHKPQHCPKVGA